MVGTYDWEGVGQEGEILEEINEKWTVTDLPAVITYLVTYLAHRTSYL